MPTTPSQFGSWDDAIYGLDPSRLLPAIEREIAKAHDRIGFRFVSASTRSIMTRRYAPNSEFTIALKATSTPLVGGSQGSALMASITHKATTEDGKQVLWVGCNRSAKAKDGKSLVPIAKALHDGFSINLLEHPKVRMAMMARLREVADGTDKKGLIGKAVLLLRKIQAGHTKKMIWVIPPRRFIEDVLNSKAFQEIVRTERVAGMRRAIATARKR